MSRESRGERANRRVQMRRGPDERAGRARKRARARPRASPALRPGDGLCMETSAEEEKKPNARPRTHRSWAACSPSSAAAPRADARVGPPYSFELFLRRSWTRRACVTAPECRHCYPGFDRRCLKLPVTLYLHSPLVTSQARSITHVRLRKKSFPTLFCFSFSVLHRSGYAFRRRSHRSNSKGISVKRTRLTMSC